MRLVMATAPVDLAPSLAKTLVQEKLAACVNVVPQIMSVYVWKGNLEQDTESLLLIKTTPGGVERLCTRLRELHSYEVPEIISFEILNQEGNPDYLKWIEASVKPGDSEKQ